MRIQCTANKMSNSFDIIFDSGYLPGGERFIVQVGGLTNPKEVKAVSSF